MKRFLAWLRRPKMHIHFVEPGKRTNPLAEQAVESLQRATASLESAVGLVNKLQDELTRVRAELAAYASICMEPGEQVAELERLRTREAPSESV